MKISRATVALFGVSMLAMVAGVVTGTLGARVSASPANASGGSSLSQELGLSSDQRDQMQRIWEKVRTTAHQCQEQAQQLQKQRDDSVFALLTDEQKAKYTQITTECVGKVQALNAQREAAFSTAVAQTKSMLNESQRQAYEQLIDNRLGQRISDKSDDSDSSEVAMQH
jgi:hypothetical protein